MDSLAVQQHAYSGTSMVTLLRTDNLIRITIAMRSTQQVTEITATTTTEGRHRGGGAPIALLVSCSASLTRLCAYTHAPAAFTSTTRIIIHAARVLHRPQGKSCIQKLCVALERQRCFF